MSDLNDDLLNYDIGEDINEEVLLAADEDDLLLSDEEIVDEKTILKDETEQWPQTNLKTDKSQSPKQNEDKKIEECVTTTTTPKLSLKIPPEKVKSAEESDVSTSEESPTKIQSQEITIPEISSQSKLSKNDEVSSTYKEIADQTISQTTSELVEHNEDINTEKSAEPSTPNEPSTSDNGQSSDPREDADEERGERTNIKLSVERDDRSGSSPEKIQAGRYVSKRGRGGMSMRGHFPGSRPPVRYPHLNYPHYPNENINPQIVPGGQYPGPYGPVDPQMSGVRPPPPYAAGMPPHMEYRPMAPNFRPLGPNFRPHNPNDFGAYRGIRPDYMNGVQYNNFGPHGMRPMFRPNGASQVPPHLRQRMPMQRPPGPPIPGQGNFISHQHPPMGPGGPPVGPGMSSGSGHPGASNMAGHNATGSGQGVLPRKVLINPNFKGGVEAATSQLMKDTQFMQAISSHVSHLQSDEELLRQQEEFINKNRIHIEKRRYERSPERNRSRERSYSPPRRGDRERRGDSREKRAGSRGRMRRGGSREFESRNPPKRRRSGSFERRKEKEKEIIEEEDEETRAYRLEIEKQKEMREKIWRDKEMRRRRAAEEKQNEEKPTTSDEPPSKLKPIIVTESKIISLKRKPKGGSDENEKHQSQQPLLTTVASQKLKPIQRTIPTAKILPEAIKKTVVESTTKETLHRHSSHVSSGSAGSATLAVIKPVVKKTVKKPQNPVLDEDELLEEELLADTPSPPASPKSLSPIDPFPETSSRGGGGSAFISSNRRVILKSSKEQSNSSGASEQTKKGIFDRLEKRKIMIKNAE